MALERRPPKKGDQDKITEAVNLIYDLMSLNQQVEPSLWAGAIISVLVNGYRNCGMSHKMFKTEMTQICDHFEDSWNE